MNMRAKVTICIAVLLGCTLALPTFAADKDVPAKPTFTQDVAPILHRNCVTCHQPGAIGPMSLRTYDEVRPWVKSILKNVESGTMPPWHADPGFGPFKNDRSMEQHETETVLRWARQGALKGDPKLMPTIPEPPQEGWQLGEPEYVIEFKEVEVPAEGPDQFYDLLAKTDLPEDKWITGVEILPGDRRVVHHVILWQSEDGTQGGNPEGWIGAWAAGALPQKFPEGTGKILKKGATIIGDMHYHPTGDAATDKTKVGFHFAEEEDIDKELINLWVINTDFAIPPGDPNYEAKASWTFPQDSHILTLTPHMHYRGKDFKYTLTYPDGEKKELLKVSDYDFNWQTGYEFEEPVSAPKGTRIDCVAHWDNSADNPDNPDPTKTVTFGNESYDEMMIGFVDYVVDEGVRPKPPAESPVVPKAKELAKEYPGQVWLVEIPSPPGQPPQVSALVIPREGEGGWHVEIGTMIGKARVYDIEWDGDSFECKAAIPGQGVVNLDGHIDADNKRLLFDFREDDGDSNRMSGRLVE